MARKDRDPSCLSREESPRFSLPRLRAVRDRSFEAVSPDVLLSTYLALGT